MTVLKNSFLVSILILFLVFSAVFVLAQEEEPVDTSVSGVETEPFESIEDYEAATGITLPQEVKDEINRQLESGEITLEELFIENPLYRGGEPLGNASCFDYYTFGSVNVQLTSEIGSAVAGVPMTFTAVVTNKNNYPIVDGDLFIKVFREQEEEVMRVVQGNHLVDEFFAVRDVTLDAGQSRSFTFVWNVPDYTPSGTYYAATFFATNERYNLLGLTFTDDIIGSSHRFSVDSENDGVYFDKNAVTIDGNRHQFIAAPPTVSENDPVVIRVPIVNDANIPREVSITWTLYHWDVLLEENRLDQRKETVVVLPGESTTVEYEIRNTDYPVYLVVPELSFKDAKSYLNVRVVRAGKDRPRINFPGVTSYPLIKGEENTLFTCLHNTGNSPTVDGKLTLEVFGDQGRSMHNYVYEGPISGEMMGLVENFVPRSTERTFTVAATLESGGEVIEQVEITYDCNEIAPRDCPLEGGFFSADSLNVLLTVLRDNVLLLVGVVVVIVLILVFVAMYARRGKQPFPPPRNEPPHGPPPPPAIQ